MDIKINITADGIRRYPHHRHKQYEIMHYVKGSGEMWTENGSIPFAEGTVIIIPPGVLHGSVSDGEFKNISVECDFEGLLLFDLPTAITGAESDEGAQLIRIIWDNRYKSELYLHSLCVAYVRYLLQRVEIEGQMASAVSGIIKSITDKAFDPEIDVTAILKQSGYTEDYIRMCFKRETGKAPIAFLTDIRIKQACYLIDVYGDMLALSDIAERCGYTDYIYFSKKFKQIMKVSPSEYRDK